MKIAGLQKMTLLDYPGKVAATVFLGGCNFRCPYCHNASLIQPDGQTQEIAEEAFFSFLRTRKGLIDGVCVSGGEPLLQDKLDEFLQKIKDLGFLVKLDTNGSYPDRLKCWSKAALWTSSRWISRILRQNTPPPQAYRAMSCRRSEKASRSYYKAPSNASSEPRSCAVCTRRRTLRKSADGYRAPTTFFCRISRPRRTSSRLGLRALKPPNSKRLPPPRAHTYPTCSFGAVNRKRRILYFSDKINTRYCCFSLDSPLNKV